LGHVSLDRLAPHYRQPHRAAPEEDGEIVQVEPPIKPLGQKGGYAIGYLPVVDFASADVLKRWVQGMRAAGVSRSTEAKTWTVISSALSWAVEDDSWPLSVNGCLTMQRRRGMRLVAARRFARC